MQKLRKIFHFSNSFSLLFTLLLTVGALISGCNDKDRDLYSETALKVDVYVDVSAVNLDYDELYAQFAESASPGRGAAENGELIRLNVDESGKALLAERVPVGSLLRFKLFFMMADGAEAGCYDKLAAGVIVTEGDDRQCVIPVDEVMPPEPVPDPTPEPSPTVSPEPSPSPSVSPTPEPTPEPTPTVTPTPEPSPSASPTPEPSPSPSASPTASPDPVDVYLKVEGDLPDMGQISVRCAGWSEKIGEPAVVTFDKNGVTTEPIAVKRQVGDRLQLGVYFEQQEDWVYFDYEDRNIWIDEEYYWQSVFYYERKFQRRGEGRRRA